MDFEERMSMCSKPSEPHCEARKTQELGRGSFLKSEKADSEVTICQ